MGVDYENTKEDPNRVAGVLCTGIRAGIGGNDAKLVRLVTERERCITITGSV
jgi:hypothetical protein